MNPDEFRQQLFVNGLLADSGVPGLYHRSFAFEYIVRGLEQRFSNLSEQPPQNQLYFAPIMPRSLLQTTDYLASFPNLIGAVSIFDGGDPEHRELLRLAQEDREWMSQLKPAEIALCSAACHQVYPLVAGSEIPPEGLRFEINGFCFRNEPTLDPVRMQSFRMHEYVYIGTAEGALAHREAWRERGSKLLADLGLDIDVVPANDPFFGRSGRMLAVGQQEKELKYEIVAQVSSDEPNAISSANYHETHFGEKFGIRTADGSVAHSACFAFGLERIALALLRRHGFDCSTWPADTRDAISLRQRPTTVQA